MKTNRILLLVVVLGLVLGGSLFARDIPAVVDVAWLEANLNNPKLIVLDVRKAEDYKAGHIPGAVNSFYGPWAPNKGQLSAELPEQDDLQDLITGAGISSDSWVVVVESSGKSRFHFATRVAWTLAYAGLDNVAVLAEGYEGWTKAGKKVSTEGTKKPAGKFTVKPRKQYVVSMNDVLKAMNGGTILDARPYNDYFGVSKPAFVAQFGHVPSAYPLPADWFFTPEDKFVAKSTLEEAVSAIGLNGNQEIITYCNSGVFCSAAWWVLHEVLGWQKVASYDGSAQEISRNPSVKFRKYVWR